MKAKDATIPKNDNIMQVCMEMILYHCENCDHKGDWCAGCLVNWLDARAWACAGSDTFSMRKAINNSIAFAKEMGAAND